MMNSLIDISPLISPRIGVWTGDTPFSHEYLCTIKEGSNLDLSYMKTTMHLGAHADAPSHYIHPGEGIAERSLAYYYGPVQVVHVDISRGERILPKHMSCEPQAERILFCTRSFPDPDIFTTDFCALSPELIHHLAERGVILVGIDTPSIDPYSSKSLESHQAVAKYDLAVLEGLILEHVPEGCYCLMAFPLKIEGADAAPVRAILRKLD